VLPYVRHFLPAAEIVPIAGSIRSQQADWDRLVPILPRSSPNGRCGAIDDFSHYLPRPVAVRHDQEVLNILSAADRRCRSRRWCSRRHTDSPVPQYVQMRLQQQRFGSRAVVIANANSQRYSDAVESGDHELCGADLSGRRSQAGRRAERSSGLAHLLLRRHASFSRHLLPGAGRPDRPASRLRDEMQRCSTAARSSSTWKA